MTGAWIPETLEALERALRDGLLVEGHHADFKRELPGGAAANKALAKDLAAFAIDGGRLFIGVDESPTPVVQHVDLAGLKERIDQIARSSVTPPLSVRCIELPAAADPATGCLIVVVPPSPSAPHQASERFWGRGDTTNHVLSSSEVAVLYERRAQRHADMNMLLDGEVSRDPTPEDMRELGHMFVVAEPEGSDDELFLRALGENRFSTWVHKSLHPTFVRSQWAPDIPSVSSFSRRAHGWAVHDYCISEERRVRPNGEIPPDERNLLDMEVHEDGGVRLFSSRATDVRDGTKYFVDAVVAGLVLRVVETARAVAETAGFYGTWQFGVAVTNIRDAISHHASRDFSMTATGFSEDSFRRAAAATYEELDDVIKVASKLTAPLLRGFQSPFTLDTLRTGVLG